MGRKIWIGACAAAAVALGILIWRLDIPNWKKLEIDRLYSQPLSSIVYDASGEAVGAFSTGNQRVWTPLSDIPEYVQKAFLAAEDQRFYEHSGISLRRILAALISNLRTRSYAQGASTITQQLIKLTHLSEQKTLSRKVQEAFLALQLERKLSKDEILECYLNTVYFGRGAYGIGAAAQAYFSKDASELTLPQAALLAGVIKAPSNYAPHINPDKSVSRRNLILNQMADCGYITPKQAENAKNDRLLLVMRESDAEKYGWFMDAALSEAADVLSMSVDDVLSAGCSIHTAFEPAFQEAADRLFSDNALFPSGASDGTPVQAALVAMRPETGEICAVTGGRSYDVQRGMNRAVQMRRSPGSAIKPVSVYAAAIDAFGLCPTSPAEDTPREFSGGYTPGNAGGSSYGTVTLREALSRSLNIATVDLADTIGIDSVRNYAKRFGLPLSAQDSSYALALGSMTHGVSPSELCAAYSALANGGTKVRPHIIRSIEEAEGRVLYSSRITGEQAVKDSTAYMLTNMLKTAASTGSAKALSSVGIPIAGKTGTVSDADGSTRDVWTAACTPDLALTVWMGYDTPDKDHRLPSSEGGSGYPARLCAAFLKSIRSQLSGADFQKPSSVKTALLDAVALDNGEVLLATEDTPPEYVTAELFHPDSLPQAFSENWIAPDPVIDLQILSAPGETPVLQFTAQDDRSEYLILRSDGQSTDVAASLTGSAGEILRFADAEADLSIPLTYTVLPRHRLLYERGTLLTGKESAAAAYSPGGLMGLLFGSDGNVSAPEPADIELNDTQSMFG